MKSFPVVLDLETKHSFRDFKTPQELGVSVVGIYDYRTNKGGVFTENELNELFPILEKSSYIIGFNIDSFDIPALEPYYSGEIKSFSTFDILEDVRKIIGKRLALNDFIEATLKKKKSGHGLMAIDYYKDGEWEKLKNYCLDDAVLTKDLFEYGIKNGEIFYLNEFGKQKIEVSWKKYLEEPGRKDISLTLPF